MKKFDVIIVGNGVSAITSANYLTKRMRNVALFLVDQETKVEKGARTLKDSEGYKYRFNVPHYEFGGLNKEELLAFYLNRLGIKEKFKVIPNKETSIVTRSQKIVTRPNSLKGFKLYLVRHYPKSRDAIHRFFDDLESYYENYKQQKQSFLRNQPYTITTLQAAWGTKNLKSVLREYFNDPDLIREFGLMQHSIGLELEDINAYFFLIRWFTITMEQSYYIQNSYNELNRILLDKNEYLTVFSDDKIESIEVENDEVKRLITNKGSYEAEYFCINAHPRAFINDFLKEGKGLISKRVDSMFKERLRRYKKYTAFIGLKTDNAKINMHKVRYFFDGISENTLRLLTVVNYKLIHPKVTDDERGAVLVEFLDDPKEDHSEDLITLLKRYFKGIENQLAVIEISEGSDYAGSYDYAKDQERTSLTKRFEFEKYRYVNVWKNTYFMGSYTRPEAGITGLIQMGIDIGALIDNDLDYQIRESTGVTPDVLMNIVSHQCQTKLLEKPLVGQFVIGKNSYILSAYKEVELQRGTTEAYDFKFISTIEALYDIAVNCRSLDESINQNLFQLEGTIKPERIYQIFHLGQKMNHIIYPPIKPFGSIMFHSLLIIMMSFSVMSLYLPIGIAAFIASGLHIGKLLIQTLVFKKIIFFDIYMTGISLIIATVSVIGNGLDWFHLSLYWGVITFVWIGYKLKGVQLTHQYLKYDYQAKYAYTALFNTMMRGLSTIWGFTLIFVTIMHLVFVGYYQTIALYAILMMMYLTIKYPSLYIQNTIKKGGD